MKIIKYTFITFNCYSVGKGIIVEKKPVEFTSGLNAVSRIEKAGTNYNSTPCEHKKNRFDRLRNDNILYFLTKIFVRTFLSEAALENQMLLNNHSYSLTALDRVNKIYINHVYNQWQ